MNSRLPRRAALTNIFVAVLTFFSLAVPGIVKAGQPYFKVAGQDVLAGGWFNTASGCANGASSLYQAPIYSQTNHTYSLPSLGGIETYYKTGGGSTTNLAATALGDINVDPNKANPKPTYYGFNSGQTFSSTNQISSASSGGDFEGTTRQSHCIPDYYTTMQQSPASFNGTLSSIANSGQYTCNPNCAALVDLAPSVTTIGLSKSITVFIKGNVYIGSDIKYAAGDTDATAPKFVLVVQGNVYVGSGVHQLDGWYIAQPDPSDLTANQDNTGNIWTCHQKQSTDLEDQAWVATNCGSKLTVNGSLTAKEVEFLRTGGDIGTATSAEDINYTPEMVVGGPFFSTSAAAGSQVIQSITSVPPVL